MGGRRVWREGTGERTTLHQDKTQGGSQQRTTCILLAFYLHYLHYLHTTRLLLLHQTDAGRGGGKLGGGGRVGEGVAEEGQYWCIVALFWVTCTPLLGDEVGLGAIDRRLTRCDRYAG